MNDRVYYRDRYAAGIELAGHLSRYGADPTGGTSTVVLGLVRGGVPVAAAVARRLGVPLDALVVRKLGVPWAPEVAFGALGPDGLRIVNEAIASRLGAEAIAAVVRQETAELLRRERHYRAGRPPLGLIGLTAVIVDDGLATGATARIAVAVARRFGAARVVLAAPVGAAAAVAELSVIADEVVCPVAPADFRSVSGFYTDFAQVSDADVLALLRSGEPAAGGPAAPATAGTDGPATARSDGHVDEAGEV